MEEACQFIKESKRLNLFATKFQLYNEEVIRPIHNTIKNQEITNHLREIMLDFDKAKLLFDYGKSVEQKVFFTPMFEEAVDWCEAIGVGFYKIRFKDAKNKKLIKLIEKTEKPFFISMNYRNKPLTKKGINLYCSPNYPSVPYNYNFYFDNKLYLENIGISNHCKGKKLIKKAIKYEVPYFELHMMLNNTHHL